MDVGGGCFSKKKYICFTMNQISDKGIVYFVPFLKALTIFIIILCRHLLICIANLRTLHH